MHRAGYDVQACALASGQTFLPQAAHVDFDVGVLQFLDLGKEALERVHVQATTKTLVGGEQDDAGTLDDVAACEKGMLQVRIGLSEVRHYGTHLLGIRTGSAHTLLRFAHLGGRHHLHCAGDLLRVLHASDLGENLFADCHILNLSLT